MTYSPASSNGSLTRYPARRSRFSGGGPYKIDK
jgi:hypothetical protein